MSICRVRPAGRGIRKTSDTPELPERWLLAEWPATEPEPVQFWLSSLPSGMPLATLVRLAKLRWRTAKRSGGALPVREADRLRGEPERDDVRDHDRDDHERHDGETR